MSGEIFQAQVIKNFFESITGPDRNLTRIYMCVVSLAKLRTESPERMAFLLGQMKKSKQKRELSIDILDYVCDAAIEIDMQSVQTAFGVKEIQNLSEELTGISLDSL